MKRVLRTIAPSLFVLAMFALTLYLLHRELQHYQLHDFLDALAAIPTRSFWLAIILTACSYLLLMGYEWLALHSIRRVLPLRRIALVSFLGYSIGNNLGTLLGGSTVRYRLYASWGLSAVEIVKLVLMLSATFWFGVFTLSGVLFIIDPITLPDRIQLPVATTRPLGIILGAVAIAYLGMSAVRSKPLRIRHWEVAPPQFTLSFMQYAVAALDLLVAAGVLYVLLPPSLEITFAHWVTIYLLAIVAALITQVPGGLGVLELVMLLMLNPAHPHEVVGALLAYRLIYYLCPLTVGLLILGGNEIAMHRHHAVRVTRADER